MALDRKTGGKATRPDPEPGQAQSQKSLIDWVRESFENARAKGNAANEKRYGEILDLYTGLEKNQKERWSGIDERFDKLVENLDTRSDKIGDQIADIADTAIKEVTGRGKERIEDTASKYDTGRKGLQDLSDKATGDIKDVGEEAREGVRARGKADLADLRQQAEGVGKRAREDYKGAGDRAREDYKGVEDRGRAERKGTEADVLGGYKGQQAEQKTGSASAKSELGKLFSRAKGEQAGAADEGIGETQKRFARGGKQVQEGYGDAEKRAGGLSDKLASQIGDLSSGALKDLSARAEGRLKDLGGDYEGFAGEQQDRMAAGREQVGGRMGDLREGQAGKYGEEQGRATEAASAGREQVTGEYAAGREEAGGRYAGRTERGLGMYGDMGDASLARIDRQFNEQKEKTVAKIQQSMIARGMDNTTVRQAVDRAEADIERNRQEAIANVESNVRQQQAGAFERLSGTEQAAQDRLQAAGLGAGAQMTSAELAGDRQLGGQSLASAERLGQADVGAEAQAIGRAEGAGQQIGLAGLAQQAAGTQGISAAEQAIGRQALGEQTGALRQGGAAQLGLAAEAARAGAGMTQAGLSAEQQQAMAKQAAGIALSQQEIASIQGIIGSDLQAQQQTGLAGLSAQERMAQGRAAAGQQAGLAGAGAATQAGLAGAAAGTQSGLSSVAQQAAGQGALLGADRGLAERTAAGQFGQIGAGSQQQAAMLGQELGERGTGQRQLTGIEGQLAGQGAGGAIGNLAQQQAAQVGVGQQQIGSAEAAGLGLSQTAQNRMDFMERRTDTVPSWESYADLVKAAGAAGDGVGSVGGVMPTGTGGGNNAAQQQQMDWMRGQIEAGQKRAAEQQAQQREDGKQRLRDKAKERQAQRDREADIRKEERMTNEERFDRESKKLDSARREGQDKVDGLNSELRAAEAAGNAAMTGELRKQLDEAKARAAKLEEGQKVIDSARDKATDTGGRMGNVTVNVTTGAVNVGQNEVKGGDGEWKYATTDEDGNESYQDEPTFPGDPYGGGEQNKPKWDKNGNWIGDGPDPTKGGNPPPTKPTGGFGNPFDPNETPGGGGQPGKKEGGLPVPTQPQQPQQPTPQQPQPGPTPGGDGQPGGGDGQPTPPGQPTPTPPGTTPTPTGEKQPGEKQPGGGGGGIPVPDNKPADLPAGTDWNPRTGKWVDQNGGVYFPNGRYERNDGPGARDGIPKPTGLPAAAQLAAGDPWDSSQGSYDQFMQNQQAMIDVNGQQMHKQDDGTYGPSTGMWDDPWGSGGAETTGIVRGDEGGMGAMAQLGTAAAQPQAQPFAGNAMMGQVAQPQAGGQQLAAKEPINDQQMEGMMQVMPNLGGDGSALGLGMGGQMSIYQQQLAKQQGIIDQADQGGGGQTTGIVRGDEGGMQGGGGGDGGGGQRPRPWSQDVMTPEFNPNDIAGTQGGKRPPVFLPGGGGFGTGTGEAEILNSRGQGSSFTDHGLGGRMKNTRESGSPTASHPGGNNQWEGWDFAKQDTGGTQQQPPPQASGGGRFSPGGSFDQMVSQQNQRANDSYNAQVAAGGHQDYFQKFGGTSIGGRAGYEANKAAMDADNANRQVIANAQQKRLSGNPGAAVGYRDTVTAPGASRPAGLSGLSSQANPSMSQAPQSMPAARGGLNSLATKAKPRSIPLNQMYRR